MDKYGYHKAFPLQLHVKPNARSIVWKCLIITPYKCLIMQSCKVAIILCFENVIVLVWYTVDETVMLSRTFHQLEKQF